MGLHGIAFVCVCPCVGILFIAEITAVVAHLLFGIVVDVGQRGTVSGVAPVICDISDTHDVNDSVDCWPSAPAFGTAWRDEHVYASESKKSQADGKCRFPNPVSVGTGNGKILKTGVREGFV